MRKKLLTVLIVLAAVAGTAAVLTSTPAKSGSCPKGTHLFDCGSYSFCCPNNALCICGT